MQTIELIPKLQVDEGVALDILAAVEKNLMAGATKIEQTLRVSSAEAMKIAMEAQKTWGLVK